MAAARLLAHSRRRGSPDLVHLSGQIGHNPPRSIHGCAFSGAMTPANAHPSHAEDQHWATSENAGTYGNAGVAEGRRGLTASVLGALARRAALRAGTGCCLAGLIRPEARLSAGFCGPTPAAAARRAGAREVGDRAACDHGVAAWREGMRSPGGGVARGRAITGWLRGARASVRRVATRREGVRSPGGCVARGRPFAGWVGWCGVRSRGGLARKRSSLSWRASAGRVARRSSSAARTHRWRSPGGRPGTRGSGQAWLPCLRRA